jgi:hypothetical protein
MKAAEMKKKLKLAHAWIAFCMTNVVVREYDENFWAYEELNRLCEEKPSESLKIIKIICEYSESDEVLANVAAGPFEDLLARHGKEIVKEVEDWATENKKNRRVLASIWKNEIDNDVWDVLKKLTDGASSF